MQQEEYPVRKRSGVNFAVPESIHAGEKGRAERRDGPSRDAAPRFPGSASHPRVAGGSVLTPVHPLAALLRISIPTN